MTTLSAILVAAQIGASPALAQAPSAEQNRLEIELLKLAQRNTWNGVDRTYRKLLDLGVALPPQDHYLAGRAALANGATLLAWYRLRRAERSDPGVDSAQRDAHEAASQERDAIEARYGMVSIYVGEGAVPVLFRETMPFALQERDAIVTAQRIISEGRAFRGFLPIGSYAIDAVKFEVAPHNTHAAGPEDADEAWLVITAGER